MDKRFKAPIGDFDRESLQEILDLAYTNGYICHADFSLAMRDLLISKDGWVLDTGNGEMVNAEVLLRLVEKINKHPVLWKLFMVA